jgi:hypothetical protein
MAQPKVQAPFIPGQKEAVDLMNDNEERRSGDGDAKKEEDEKLYGDYYTPKQTEVVGKGSNEQTDLYSPESAATLVVNHEQRAPKPSSGDGQSDEQSGAEEERGTVMSTGAGIVKAGKGMATEMGDRAMSTGSGVVEAGKGVATEVGDTVMGIRARVMERLAGLHLPTETLDAIRRTFETGVKGTRDAVQRTRQSLADILPSSLSSDSNSAGQVVEDVEKDMLGNFEGSGEDRSQVLEGPKGGLKDTKDTDETRPTFMRAKL